MKKRFTGRQILGFLREAKTGVPVNAPCRKHGFGDACFYTRRTRLGGMEVDDAKRLKKPFAEPMLDNEALRAALSRKRWPHKRSVRRC